MSALSRLSFLSLPLELRIQVYEFVFRHDPGVIVLHSCQAGSSVERKTLHALFLTCKHIREEALEEYQIILKICESADNEQALVLRDYERQHITHIEGTTHR